MLCETKSGLWCTCGEVQQVCLSLANSPQEGTSSLLLVGMEEALADCDPSLLIAS